MRGYSRDNRHEIDSQICLKTNLFGSLVFLILGQSLNNIDNMIYSISYSLYHIVYITMFPFLFSV